MRRLQAKIQIARRDIALMEEDGMEDAEFAVIAYGITSRVARRAVAMARERGLRVGYLRLITVWPFPDWKIQELARSVRAFVVPELNLGQMVREVRSYAGGTPAISVTHAGGSVHRPEQILEAILEAAR